jgi:hypothetical protein
MLPRISSRRLWAAEGSIRKRKETRFHERSTRSRMWRCEGSSASDPTTSDTTTSEHLLEIVVTPRPLLPQPVVLPRAWNPASVLSQNPAVLSPNDPCPCCWPHRFRKPRNRTLLKDAASMESGFSFSFPISPPPYPVVLKFDKLRKFLRSW